jgi:hypothetical protein
MPPEPSPDVDPEAKAAEREKPAPTPFDNPWLLPTLLIGFALWFSYDGWLNPNIKSIMFNRICAPIFAALALWSLWGARKEHRARREHEGRDGTSERS